MQEAQVGDWGRLRGALDRHPKEVEEYEMNVQLRITRTDTGSNTRLKADNEHEASKDYGSWDDALNEAKELGLLNGVEAAAAKILPPGMPFNKNCDVDGAVMNTAGFSAGKTSPPQ